MQASNEKPSWVHEIPSKHNLSLQLNPEDLRTQNIDPLHLDDESNKRATTIRIPFPGHPPCDNKQVNNTRSTTFQPIS